MATYSIQDVLLELRNECEMLHENWQGETSDTYMNNVMGQYISYANAIEKCLQGINDGLDEVMANFEDDDDSIYNHAPKRI